MTSTATKTYAFGSGSVICLANGKPVKVGCLQDIEIDISSDTKMLYGQNQFPDAIARGQGKISGKAKTGTIDLNLFNSLYAGQTLDATGYEKLVENEAKAVPAASTYTVTATNAAGFTQDMGVYYANTGVQLTQVAAGSEAAGKYSVNANTGVYTFAAADASAAVLISYNYNSANGSNVLVTNQQTGINPVFQLFLQEGFTGAGGRTNVTMKLFSCVSSKLTFPFKNDDFAVSDFEFDCFADTSGNVYSTLR